METRILSKKVQRMYVRVYVCMCVFICVYVWGNDRSLYLFCKFRESHKMARDKISHAFVYSDYYYKLH